MLPDTVARRFCRVLLRAGRADKAGRAYDGVMARSGPTSIALPEFSGSTRRLVIWNLAAFFAVLVLGALVPTVAQMLLQHTALDPARVVHGEVWQLVTYSFLNLGLLNTLFGMLMLWWTGAMLEGRFGGRWLMELYFASVVGGALLATLLWLPGLLHSPVFSAGAGLYPGVFGLLVAVAIYFGEMEILFFFVIRMKAKYMVAIYILIDLARLLGASDRFGALLRLSAALCGFLFLTFVPRKGLAFGLTEQFYGLRNEYYRNKRRKAARKFEVYMKTQNREVHFDKDGHYVDPDSGRGTDAGRDPTDKRWMN